MKHILKFIKLPVKERMLLLEAFFFLFYSKFLLYFPFRYCIKKFKKKEQLGVNPTQDILTAVSIAVARANRVAFWKNVCLVKSFAARFMLERRNIVSTIY
ncbi:MAG: lasso peptide biosynthesis B2 protein, partial [Bacteroidota bacterium]|nr:lasso peptide biosynthesis B2 protein [Bacteroidota bacterium]